jgi:hypothetical protein
MFKCGTWYLCFCFLSVKSPVVLSLFTKLWIVLSAGNSFITKFTSTFLPALSNRSVFHMGDIQKYTLLESILHHDLPYCALTVPENKWLMELISATYCWQIINSHTAHCVTKYRQAVHKLITSLHSKCYWLSGMLIHQQNSYAPHSEWHTGCRGAQSHVPGPHTKNPPCILGILLVYIYFG